MIARLIFSLSMIILAFWGSAIHAIICNICDYTKADQCEHHGDYRQANCSTFWSDSKYCLKFNGKRNAVRHDGGEINSSGVHRACQQETDLDSFGLQELQSGCRAVHVFNKNTTIYRHFSFDGVLCICDAPACNHGSRLSPAKATLLCVFCLSQFLLSAFGFLLKRCV